MAAQCWQHFTTTTMRMPQQGMVWAIAATSLACLAAALRPTTQPPPKRRNSLVRTASDVAAGAVMPAVLLGVVGAAAAGAEDAEGAVGRVIPTRLARLLRDSRIAWRQFTAFEAVAGFVALAAADAKDSGRSLVQAGRALLEQWRRAGETLVESRNEGGHVIDLYTGAADAATRPLVVLVPGGGWCHGDDARLYRLLAARVAKRSRCEVAVAQYAPWPLGDGEDMVDAVAAALTWAERRRPGGVVAVGLSAGAHLVAAASTTRGTRPAAAALCSGVFDLEEHYAHESRRGVHDVSALGAAYAGKMRAYSPVCGKTFADKVLLVHGAADLTAPLTSGADAVAAVHAAAPDVVFTRVDVEGGHLDYAMRAMRDDKAPFLDWVDDLVEGVAGEMD